MKKTIFALAFATVAVTGLQAVAQQADNNNAPQGAPCYGPCNNGAPCVPQAYGQFGAPSPQDCNVDSCMAVVMMAPFADLNLNDDQKGKILELGQKYAPLTPQQVAEQRKAKRADYLKDLKNILSEDQYVVFLENNYVNAGVPGPKVGKGKPFGQGRFQGQRPGGGKKFDKGDKPGKPGKDQANKERKDKKDKKDKKDRK